MSDIVSGNPGLMRDMNRSNILDVIRKHSPISQAELAKKLNLRPSTILRIMRDLENEGLIYQCGIGEVSSKGGRKAALWKLNPKGASAIGVDLGAEEIITVLVDLQGNIIGRIRKPCPSDRHHSIVMEEVFDTIDYLFHEHAEYIDKIIGIGVGLPGKMDSENGISRYAVNFSNWNDVPVRQILKERFGLPTYMEGDMKLMALAEKWYGAGADAQNIICIGYRRGIGLGIVINGEIYKGDNYLSGDIGHIVVDPNGNKCICGRRGCLEAVASETAILEWMKEYIERNGVGNFNGIINSVDEVNMEKIYEALQENSFIVVDRMKESARYLGRAVSDLVRIFDPQKIIIGGKMLEVSPMFLKTVQNTFESEQPNYIKKVPNILPSGLSDHSIALGGAVLVLSRLFKAL